MDNFYEPGDCLPLLRTANEQLAKGDAWRERLQLQIWKQNRDKIYAAINELWKIEGRACVSIWEEDWFPSIEQFLSDLQKMGYHVYVGSTERRDNQGMTQKRYCVYLEELPDATEWSIENEALL